MEELRDQHTYPSSHSLPNQFHWCAIIHHYATHFKSSSALPLRILVLHLLLIGGLIRARRILLQHTFANQVLGLRTMADLLVQAVSSHVFLEFALLTLDGGCRGGVGENVAFLKKSIYCNNKYGARVDAYVQPSPLSEVSSPSPFSGYPLLAGVPVHMRLIEVRCLFTPQLAYSLLVSRWTIPLPPH